MCLAALAVCTGAGADWTNRGGDASHSNWQRRETAINPSNAANLQAIWKRPLNGTAFSSPVILGRLVTHRGTVELVFILTNTGDLYAVDGDFGTVFWKRHFDGYRPSPCQRDVPTPVLAPAPPNQDEEEDDDAPQPLRPLYVLTTDGRLHAVHPGLGSDLQSWQFVPPNVHASDLNLTAGVIATTTSPGCGETSARAWSLDVSNPGASPHSEPAKAGETNPLRATTDSNAYELRNGAIVAGGWTSKPLSAITAPVVGGGLVFALSNRAVLYALDAATGKPHFTSASAGTTAGSLALANGHVCFITSTGTLVCFGFPVDR